MAQGFSFLFQLTLFTFFQISFFQLLQLETNVIFILAAFLSLFDKIFQFTAYLPVVCIYLLVLGKLFIILRQNIQYIQLETLFVE